MRIALVGISQESDTFNPVPSSLENFRNQMLLFDRELFRNHPEKDTLQAAVDFFSSKPDVELVPLFWANCVAGGRMDEKTTRYFKNELITRLRAALPLDGILFSLHGAHAAENVDDFAGFILTAARETVGNGPVISVPMDHHGVVTETIMRQADIIDGHETQPHKPYETGWKASASLYKLLTEHIRPVKCFEKIPMVAPQDQFLTSGGAMKQWFDHARELEKNPEVLSISPFPMQPWVDVESGGWSVIAYTNNNPELARSIVKELADEAWSLREEFWISERVSIEEGIREAVEADEGLVVISDTGDAVYGGGTGDSTHLLKEMIRQNIPCKAYLPIVDPEAIEKIFKAGPGKTALTVGGRTDPFSTPAEVEGLITAISPGLQIMTERNLSEIGRAALMEINNVKLVILERRNHTINLPIIYTHLGLDMTEAKMVVCKTGSNFQYFSHWRKKLIRIDTPGVTQSDLTRFTWKHIPRPTFPLDDIKDWKSNPQIVS